MLMIDYGMGNLRSVKLACRELGVTLSLTKKGEDISKEREGIILPGVGSFAQAMKNLHHQGLVKPLQEYIYSGRPFLGICLGFQVLFSTGQEGGGIKGLGIFPGRVISFPRNSGLKIPHMGWNRIFFLQSDPLLSGVIDGSYQYFVHSYFVQPETEIGLLRSFYGEDFISGISSGRVYGLQFHPEKGGEVGLRILSNFISLCKEDSHAGQADYSLS